MLNDLDADTTIKFAIYNLLVCLYEYGLDEVHLGGLLRLLGLPNETAEKYDADVVVLDDDFLHYVQEMTQTATQAQKTLH